MGMGTRHKAHSSRPIRNCCSPFTQTSKLLSFSPYPHFQLSHNPAQNLRKPIPCQLNFQFPLPTSAARMSTNINNNNDEKQGSAINTHEPGWTDVDLGASKIDPAPHLARAIVIDQGPGWTNFDLEAGTPLKKRLRCGRKTKILLGIAIPAMILVGIFVPMAVAIENEKTKGIE